MDIFSTFMEDAAVLWSYRIPTLLSRDHHLTHQHSFNLLDFVIVQNDSIPGISNLQNLFCGHHVSTLHLPHQSSPASVQPVPISSVHQLFSGFTFLSIQILWSTISITFVLSQRISYTLSNLQCTHCQSPTLRYE